MCTRSVAPPRKLEANHSDVAIPLAALHRSGRRVARLCPFSDDLVVAATRLRPSRGVLVGFSG
jgi:hypothetical protein